MARIGIEQVARENMDEAKQVAEVMAQRCSRCAEEWGEVAQWGMLSRPGQRRLCVACSKVYRAPWQVLREIRGGR